METLIKQCVVCDKPLGAESQDLDWRLCHEHRRCSVCGEDVMPRLCQQAHEHSLQDEEPIRVAHPRCVASLPSSVHISNDPLVNVRQSHLDYLNNIRLMVEPNMDIGESANEYNAMLSNQKLVANMPLEQQFIHLRMLEACVAQTSLLLKKIDKKALKEKIERETKRASVEAATSSRPVNKPADAADELEIARFAQRCSNPNDRKGVLKIMRDREKGIKALMDMMKMSRESAEASVDAGLVQRGVLRS